eukprot:CAMPEP_0172213602 /NCGR_PEP_ID=MMETSP1050-20130122/37684_1 /TAXON_ID=233186 /ORGANISM="Cryptomonas curvata, Strain CCAP979/52" /LENGTH=192 /DNA_ID=CAMNT_0012894453 /DNA_START=86 /DNA_END=660 /DNA_ORIENTATION=-
MIFETPPDFPVKKKYLQAFVETLDQWKGESDQSCIPSHIQVLISTPVRDLTTSYSPRVNMSTQIIEVLQLFQKMRTVVVSRGLDDNGTVEAPDDIILSRLTFLQHAVSVSSLSAPLSSLISVVPALGWVDTRETLDIVLQSMLVTGFEEVGVMEGGIMTGVLHVDEIFSFLAKELAWACPDMEASVAKAQRG